MKKLVKTIESLIFLIALLWAFITLGPLHAILKSQLAAAGYPDAQLGAIRYTQSPVGFEIDGIELDDTGHNAASRIVLSFIPPQLALEGLKAEIDLTQKNGIKIAGTTLPASKSPSENEKRTTPLFLPPLALKASSLTFLTEQGIFVLLLEGHSWSNDQDLFNFSLRLTAKQPELFLDAAVFGNLTPKGDLTANVKIDDSAFALPDAKGQNIEAVINAYLPAQADGEIKVKATAGLLALADIPLEKVSLSYQGQGADQTLSLHGATRDKSTSLSVEATALIQQNRDLKVDGTFNITAEKLEKIKPSLSGSGNLDLAFSGIQKENGKWEGVKGSLDASLKDITIGNAVKKASGRLKSNITATPDGKVHALTTTPVKFSSESFSADIPASPQDPIILDIASGADDLAKFSGNIGKLAKFSGQHNLKNGKGNAGVIITPIVFTPQFQPENLLAALKGKAEEVRGSLGADFNLAWKISGLTKTSGHILIKDMAAKYGDIAAQGINGVIALDSLSPPAVNGQTLSIARMDAGLPLTGGVITFSLTDRQLSISDMKWAMAKGSLTSDPFSLALEKLEGDVTLKAADLDLAELFALAPMDGLTATGMINGNIPVRIRGESVFIDNGVLETSIPGVIRYDPKEVPSFLENPSASSIIDLKAALKNFQYEQLKMTISGEAGQEQEIILSVKGKNPDFYNGSPVNLNLNLGGTIDKVLKSNFGAYKIPDAVQKKIEAYEKEHAGF